MTAQWAKTIFNISTMQEMTPALCSATTTPSTSATLSDTNGSHYGDTGYVPEKVLTDARDNETYRIRKLADGNCWMTENLRLTLTAGKSIEISDGTTWLPTNYDGSTTYATTLTVADYDILPTAWGFTSNEPSTTDIVRSYDTKGSAGLYKCNSPDIKVRGDRLCYETASTTDGDIQKIGVYYGWYTATAGQGTVARDTETTISICPKNWKLPPIDSNTEPSYAGLLHRAYSIGTTTSSGPETKARSFPLSFIAGGFYINDEGASAMQQNNRIGYWSATPKGDNASYVNAGFLIGYVSNGTIQTNAGDRKRQGHTIRCAISGN